MVVHVHFVRLTAPTTWVNYRWSDDGDDDDDHDDDNDDDDAGGGGSGCGYDDYDEFRQITYVIYAGSFLWHPV